MNIQSKDRAAALPRTEQQTEAMRSAAREKIRSAGLQLFSTKGLAATSVQDIATLAGISTGLMYHYYKSKEDLFIELAETAIELANNSVQLFFNTDLSPAEKIRTFSREVIDEIAQRVWMSQTYLLVIHYVLEGANPEQVTEVQARGFSPLESVTRTIIEGQALGEVKPGDPIELAVLYFAAVQGLAISKLTMGDRFVLPDPDLLSGVLLSRAKGGN